VAVTTFGVLTYNVKMLPGLFGNGDEDLARAERIAALVRQGAYDLVAFQEVFDEDARHLLLDRLRSDLPHVVTKSGDDWFNEDSGLMIFSRHAFGADPTFFEWDAVGPLWNHDRWADKGVQIARVQLAEGLTLVFANLHMQSDRDDPDEYRHLRAAQLQQLGRVLARGLVKTRAPTTLAALVAGDFNVIAGSDEHRAMLQTLKEPRDLFGETHPDEAGHTIDPANTMVSNDEEPQRLDYLLAFDEVPGGGPDGSRLPIASITVDSIGVRPFEHAGADLSDHYGVEARLRVGES
jgi:endonuclease/exonuclease/phosphatase family metal-dependent hydrolase